MQRIFNCDKIRDNSITPHKYRTFFMYESPFNYSISLYRYTSYTFRRWSGFYGHQVLRSAVYILYAPISVDKITVRVYIRKRQNVAYRSCGVRPCRYQGRSNSYSLFALCIRLRLLNVAIEAAVWIGLANVRNSPGQDGLYWRCGKTELAFPGSTLFGKKLTVAFSCISNTIRRPSDTLAQTHRRSCFTRPTGNCKL